MINILKTEAKQRLQRFALESSTSTSELYCVLHTVRQFLVSIHYFIFGLFYLSKEVSSQSRLQESLQYSSQGHCRQIGCPLPEALSHNDKCQSTYENNLFLKCFRCPIHMSSSLQDLIDAVVTAAAASADNLILSEGRDVQLEESLDLHLPFLLPEGGYSCDSVRGIPPGFREFLEPICRKGTSKC